MSLREEIARAVFDMWRGKGAWDAAHLWEVDSLLSVADAALTAISKAGHDILPRAAHAPESEWRPIAEAPKDGTVVEIRRIERVRFAPYSHKSEQRKRGIVGRWQRFNEFGAWENTADPEAEWRPARTALESQPAGEKP